jgi:hypothetical protein
VTDGAGRRGAIDATVQLLTGTQARAEVPTLFNHAWIREGVGIDMFKEIDARGNRRWTEGVPRLVVLVRNRDGGVLMAADACYSHLLDLGYPVPDEALS